MFLSVGEVEVDLGDVEFVKRSSHVRNLQGPGATGVSWTRAMLLEPGKGPMNSRYRSGEGEMHRSRIVSCGRGEDIILLGSV